MGGGSTPDLSFSSVSIERRRRQWLWIRVERTGGTIDVSYSSDGDGWTILLQATLTEADPL